MNDLPVWGDGREVDLPALDGEIDADICVVGLGGSGLAAVHELVSLGQRVVGLDADTVGSGAAGRNGGFLLCGLPAFYHRAVSQFGRDLVHGVYRRTMDELDRMTAETPDVIRRTGSLRIANDDEERADCEAQLAAMRADGLPAEPYAGIEGDGLLIPTDGVFNPLLRCRTLAARARDAGAQLFEHSAAMSISGSSVATVSGLVRCRAVIVAVDGRLDILLPELAGRVRTARLQMLATEPIPQVDLPRPVYLRYGYEYWQQLPDRRIAMGGLRDRAGQGEWTNDASPTPGLQRDLERLLHCQLGIEPAVTHRWAGLVGYSSSGLPVIAEVRPAVWAIGGYNGTGNVLGAICGRGVAQQVVRGRSGLLEGLLPR